MSARTVDDVLAEFTPDAPLAFPDYRAMAVRIIALETRLATLDAERAVDMNEAAHHYERGWKAGYDARPTSEGRADV